MRFRALNFCIMIILFNLALGILTASNVIINMGVEPQYSSNNTSSTVGTYHFGGFVDENGQLSKTAIRNVVLSVFGFLATVIATRLLTPVTLNVMIFGAIFWFSTVAGMTPVEEMMKTLGWGYMILPMYLIFGIFFIVGAMELTGGGFGGHE